MPARRKKARAPGKKAAARPLPSQKPLSQRLFLKPGSELTAFGAPPNYQDLLGPLPAGVRVRKDLAPGAALIHLFAPDGKALRKALTRAVPALAAEGVLWISYPKTDSHLARDLSRERVWEEAGPFGLRPVAQVSVDEVWSALRFKRG